MTVPFVDVSATYLELRAELDDAWQRVMSSGSYVLGPEVEAFEQEFAAYCGTSHCVGVANALDGLELVLRAWDINAGDEVIVPSNTYIASWLAISACGAVPVPVEPDRATSNLDPDRLAAAITARTRAIMPVHLYGQCAEMGSVSEIATRHGLRVLEDAAQAHGATFEGRRAGALGDAGVFSFYPTKNLGAFGDGGAVTTDDAELAERLRLRRNYGSGARGVNETRGRNSRLDELQAALLRVKLRSLDSFNARRALAAARYLDELSDLAPLRLPAVAAGADPVWHQFVVRHPERDALQASLAGGGIMSLIFYPTPPHLSSAYADLGIADGALPIAEELARTTLALPVGPHLLPEHQTRVIDAVRAFCAAHRQG
jgi:dTDP-4-amino-4,6-dideoxygalactose transaminase